VKVTLCDICNTRENLKEKTYGNRIYDLCQTCELRVKNQFIHRLLRFNKLKADDYNVAMNSVIRDEIDKT